MVFYFPFNELPAAVGNFFIRQREGKSVFGQVRLFSPFRGGVSFLGPTTTSENTDQFPSCDPSPPRFPILLVGQKNKLCLTSRGAVGFLRRPNNRLRMLLPGHITRFWSCSHHFQDRHISLSYFVFCFILTLQKLWNSPSRYSWLLD